MKLPVGSRERYELKISIEHQIVEQADRWEKARGSLDPLTPVSANTYHRAAEKLAVLVRKWRRL